MFNMGFTEMIVLAGIALIVIGPKQLPEVARVVGRMLNEFKRATGDLGSSFAGVKKEAQTLANQTQSYMHKQKAEFEQQMRDHIDLDLDKEKPKEPYSDRSEFDLNDRPENLQAPQTEASSDAKTDPSNSGEESS